MTVSSRLLAALLLPVLLMGCKGFNASKDSSGDANELQPIRYLYNNINIGFDREVVVAPNGEMRIRETRGSLPTDTRIISSSITAPERAALISGFKGWNTLNKFYPTDVSPQYEIIYGGYSVTTSNLDVMPKNYLQAKGELDRIVQIVVKAADARTAAIAARAAANAAATRADEQPAVVPPATTPNIP